MCNIINVNSAGHNKNNLRRFKIRAIEKNIIQAIEELKDADYMAWDNFSDKSPQD